MVELDEGIAGAEAHGALARGVLLSLAGAADSAELAHSVGTS